MLIFNNEINKCLQRNPKHLNIWRGTHYLNWFEIWVATNMFFYEWWNIWMFGNDPKHECVKVCPKTLESLERNTKHLNIWRGTHYLVWFETWVATNMFFFEWSSNWMFAKDPKHECVKVNHKTLNLLERNTKHLNIWRGLQYLVWFEIWVATNMLSIECN